MSIIQKSRSLRPDYLEALRRYPVPVLAAALLAEWIVGDLFNWRPRSN